MNADTARTLVRKAARLYWLQLAPKGTELRRFTLLGDLKGERRRSMRHTAYPSYSVFRKALLRVLRHGPIEAYGSLDLVRLKVSLPVFSNSKEEYERVSYCYAIDLDGKENDFSDRKTLLRVLELYNLLRKWGLHMAIKLSGGGIHLFASLHDITFKGDTLSHLPQAFNRVRVLLERKTELILDERIYTSHPLFRLAFSWHGKHELFAIPLRPHWLREFTFEELRERARDPEWVVYLMDTATLTQLYGRILSPARLRALIQLGLPPTLSRESELLIYRSKAGREERVLEDPAYGEIVYDSRLEGYGWVRVLVEEGIVLEDGRLTMCWLVLPEAVLAGVITREEAEEYLRRCYEAYPDPEKRLETYLSKFRYELERQGRARPYGLISWRSLVTEERKGGGRVSEHYAHLKPPLYQALEKVGLVRLRGGSGA